ncbi:riboflavin biosynthesis protein RibD (plasmid) [Salinigranum rubrum]|uniref:Riboflavin biosynthesis protein RibD n=1 Tax=Salinigranum rubrum TaxID=755307 RepID=A0A2I8VQR4_9EURY|nr:dihydrofolate reductase family protein [Salinigranum rubrum]AUV84263.1 riboflavin biosynthesis protein RibD [Salinigranum rubrum]
MTATDPATERTLFAFENTSLNGFFEGPNRDISWHNVDDEFNEFAAEQLDEIDCLLFGRVTYELMASYWPTATEDDPRIAERMNELPKVVVSTTLSTADWNNTTLISDNVPDEITKLKQQADGDLAIFGSSELTASLLADRLVDEFRVMVNPVVLGDGTPLFAGLPDEVELELLSTRTFASDNVLLTYRPDYGDRSQ